MNNLSKHRIERAKQKLREKLSFEYIRNIPAYKNITQVQYEELITNIETMSLTLLESFANTKI